MATIKQGILGAFSGKVGSVVGSSWKGIPVMKSLPPSVANPKTAGQVLQRGKMGQCVAFSSPVLADVIKPLNDRFASRMSGFNLFTQRNISEFGEDGIVDPTTLKLSPRGNSAQLVDAIAAERNIQTGKVKLSITTTSIAGSGKALQSDKPYAVFYNYDRNFTQVVPISDTRGTGEKTYVVEIPEQSTIANDEILIYLAFLRSDGTVVFEDSNKQCAVTDKP